MGQSKQASRLSCRDDGLGTVQAPLTGWLASKSGKERGPSPESCPPRHPDVLPFIEQLPKFVIAGGMLLSHYQLLVRLAPLHVRPPTRARAKMQSDQSRQNGLVITSSVLVAISILVVAARLAIRVCWIRNSGWDDYSIVAALLFDVGYLAEILVAKANRVGFPMATLTPQQRTNFLKDTLAIEATYYAAVAFVKISILAMYLRFLLSPTPRFLCKATIVFHAVFFLVCVAVTLGQCRPFHKAYDATLTVPGHCINSTVFFYFTSGVNIITDIWIFALPVKTLKGISRPKKEKATLIVIFGVGAFATITSIIRTVFGSTSGP
ncbi:hypothetical protein VTK73DRAFT_992 [Phialemonium thermophilum]|uniref:Rhodopsin domain-containing protein n=1 Tax=Phialemonium thermophilum TaxID=223376 RepID=A0ABR3VU22_9PEZI